MHIPCSVVAMANHCFIKVITKYDQNDSDMKFRDEILNTNY